MKEIENKRRIVFGFFSLCLGFLGHWFLTRKLPNVFNEGVGLGIDFFGKNLVVIVLLVFVLGRLKSRFDWGLWMVFAGGLINMVDRLDDGRVVDYFNMIVVYNNLPDLLLFAGVIISLVNALRYKNRL